MEQLARETLPPGFDFAWAGQSLEEIKAGSQAGYIFALSILIVYLVLAAQYESWVLPFIILLGVPLAVFGALSAQLLRGFANDVFCQVGLVMLVGLAAKNSILIVEFAEQLRERGMSIVDAAIEAARIRLRPILMTSFAFILGVLPLAFATGAGAAARNSVGHGGRRRHGRVDRSCRSSSSRCSTWSSARSCPARRVTSCTRPRAAEGARMRRVGRRMSARGAVRRRVSADRGAVTRRRQRDAAERVTFDEAVRRALEKNPTSREAAQAILRAEALLQQARTRLPADAERHRARRRPRRASAASTTRSTQPQHAVASRRVAVVPGPRRRRAGRRGAGRGSDPRRAARASTEVRRQIAVATAQAYLAVIAQQRQVEVNQLARENAHAHVDYARALLEGGAGSRLNELRAAQELATDEVLLEAARLALRRAQEALGVLLAADAPIDAAAEPAFEMVAAAGRSELAAGAAGHPAVLRAGRRGRSRRTRQLARLGADGRRRRSNRSCVTPSGLFQPSRTWRGFRRAVGADLRRRRPRAIAKRQREVAVGSGAASSSPTSSCARGPSCARRRRRSRAPSARVANARLAAQHAAEVLRITDVAFRAGATTNIELIDAQRRARDADTAAAIAEDRVRQARLDLLVALGRFPQ